MAGPDRAGETIYYEESKIKIFNKNLFTESTHYFKNAGLTFKTFL
jgi:hypothetical protein